MKICGETGFDYTQMSDADAETASETMVNAKVFFILPSELFANVCRHAADNDNLNETLEQAFRHIEQSAIGSESEDNFRGLFDGIDVNSTKLGTSVAKRTEPAFAPSVVQVRYSPSYI